MARKILENTRLRQAKRLENATAWQMGPCFGASCRSACEGAAVPCFGGTGCRGDEQARQEHVPLSDSLGWSTRAAEVLTYADVWAIDGDGRTGGRSRHGVKTQNCVLRIGSSRGWTAPAGMVAGAGGREPRTAGAAGRTRERDSKGARQGSRPDEDGRHARPCVRVSRKWTGPPVAFVILTHGAGCRGVLWGRRFGSCMAVPESDTESSRKVLFQG